MTWNGGEEKKEKKTALIRHVNRRMGRVLWFYRGGTRRLKSLEGYSRQIDGGLVGAKKMEGKKDE